MRVLYLCHRVPYPPNKGDKIRAWHEIRALAARGHHVHLVTMADDAADLRWADRLRAVCRTVSIARLPRWRILASHVASLLTGRPLSLHCFDIRATSRAVRQVMAEVRPDAIIAYSAAMATYVAQDVRAIAVLDLVDVDSEKWRDYARHATGFRRWLFAREARLVRQVEVAAATTFAGTVLTTPREVELLASSVADARLSALVNGVDASYFDPGSPVPVIPEAEAGLLARCHGDVLTFTGAMDYRANVDACVWFAREVLPTIRQQRPHVVFAIVGRNPAPAVRALGRERGIVVTGEVADIRPYLAATTLAIAPLRVARGVQNKVLEAMAFERPVIVSEPVAACLTAVAGRDIEIARSPADWVTTIARLLDCQSERQVLARRAREFVLRHHVWAHQMSDFVDLVEGLSLASPPARSTSTASHA